MEKRFLTVSETAAFLGISKSNIYNGIQRNPEKRFPVKAKRIGRKVVFDVRDLEEFCNSL